MIFLIIFLAAAAAFAVSITVTVMLIGPVLLLQPRRRTAEFYRGLNLPSTPEEAGISCQEITLPTPDGCRLRCWLALPAITQTPLRGTIIYLHGVGDCKIDGLRLARLLRDDGYAVFLYDARRHGESGGRYCTYGFHEKKDVSTIIDWLMKRPELAATKIGLFGTSMGAAVALQAAAIDHRIAAVAAENSFATLRTIFDDYQKRMIKLPFHFLRNLVIIRSERKANFKAREVSPLRSVTAIHVPLLFIVSSEDHLIKPEYSLHLFQYANEPKQLFEISGARHNDTWQVAGERYAQTLLAFYERSLR